MNKNTSIDIKDTKTIGLFAQKLIETADCNIFFDNSIEDIFLCAIGKNEEAIKKCEKEIKDAKANLECCENPEDENRYRDIIASSQENISIIRSKLDRAKVELDSYRNRTKEFNEDYVGRASLIGGALKSFIYGLEQACE